MSEQEKARLLQLLDDARREILAALEGLDSSTDIYPSWKLKHFVAHLSGWQEATITSLRAHGEGGGYEIPMYRGIDDFNTQSVEIRKDLRFEQIYAEWTMFFDDVKAAIEKMPLDKFESEMTFPWGARDSVSTLVEIMAYHEQEHARDLFKLKAAPGEAAGEVGDLT